MPQFSGAKMPFDPRGYAEDIKLLRRYKKLSETRMLGASYERQVKLAATRASKAKTELAKELKSSFSSVARAASASRIDGAQKVAEVAKLFARDARSIMAHKRLYETALTPSGALRVAKAIAEAAKTISEKSLAVAVKKVAAGKLAKPATSLKLDEISLGYRKDGSGTLFKSKRMFPKIWDMLGTAWNNLGIKKEELLKLLHNNETRPGLEKTINILVNQQKLIARYAKWRTQGLNTDTVAGLVTYLEVVERQPAEAVNMMSFQKSGRTFKIGDMKRNAQLAIKYLDMEVGTTELRAMLKTEEYTAKLKELVDTGQGETPHQPEAPPTQTQTQADAAETEQPSEK